MLFVCSLSHLCPKTGHPELHDGILTDMKCKKAKCNIPNSTGKGQFCRCEDGFVGQITWQGDKASGFCKPAPCEMPNSNKQPGLLCQCLGFYAGNITWDGATSRGTCVPRKCTGEYVNGKPGPDCQCIDGYDGHARPAEVDGRAVLVAECAPVPCPFENSNKKPGPECECKDGFTGGIYWKGNIPWTGSSCRPSPCGIENSNLKEGPECKCRWGFDGEITWRGPFAHGTCAPVPCSGKNMNGMPGPGCRCADGFSGSVVPKKEMEYAPSLFGDDEDEEDRIPVGESEHYAFQGECEPAVCDKENSNKAPGLACQCSDGYRGQISWNGSSAKGSCKAAPCNVPNSNQIDGPDCRCLDGFHGTISWKGSQHFGTCTAVPCSVLNSDFAPGPDCQCLPGFYGQITWNGSHAEGKCFPSPGCSQEIVHAAWLTVPVEDSEGKLCQSGQQLVFHGFACKEEGKVAWTSVRSVPFGRPGSSFSLERPGINLLNAAIWHQLM